MRLMENHWRFLGAASFRSDEHTARFVYSKAGDLSMRLMIR